MRPTRQSQTRFALLLGAGLLSGCTEEPTEPAQPESMFSGPPWVYVSPRETGEDLPSGCIDQCCTLPEDGIVVFDVVVSNWLLAPHEECGDEPQCGPVNVSPFPWDGWVWFSEVETDIETVEPSIAIDILEIAARQDPLPEYWVPEWGVQYRAVPRPDLEVYDAWDVTSFRVDSDETRRVRDQNRCTNFYDRFAAYAEIGPTTEPGTYTMHAELDGVAVTCTFEVLTNQDGDAEIYDARSESCSPGDMVTLAPRLVPDSPEGVPGGSRRAQLTPLAPVERVDLAISRDGQVLVEGSHEPAGEIVYPRGECSLIPCQVAESWGLSL